MESSCVEGELFPESYPFPLGFLLECKTKVTTKDFRDNFVRKLRCAYGYDTIYFKLARSAQSSYTHFFYGVLRPLLRQKYSYILGNSIKE